MILELPTPYQYDGIMYILASVPGLHVGGPCEQGKKPKGWLGYIGDYTTQLYRDCNKPL